MKQVSADFCFQGRRHLTVTTVYTLCKSIFFGREKGVPRNTSTYMRIIFPTS